jgi:hypothetical protein
MTEKSGPFGMMNYPNGIFALLTLSQFSINKMITKRLAIIGDGLKKS